MRPLRSASLVVAASLVALTGCPRRDDGAVAATTTPSCAMPDAASRAWIDERARQQPMGGVDPGAPGDVAHIGLWDTAVTWLYRQELDVTTEAGRTVRYVEEGRYQPPAALDNTSTRARVRAGAEPDEQERERTRRVTVGLTVWSQTGDGPWSTCEVRQTYLGGSTGTALRDATVPVPPMHVNAEVALPATAGMPRAEVMVHVQPGARLDRAEVEGRDVEDGSPVTVYRWTPPDQARLRLVLRVDDHGQLRRLDAVDSATGAVPLRLTAHPQAGAPPIADPTR